MEPGRAGGVLATPRFSPGAAAAGSSGRARCPVGLVARGALIYFKL